MEWTEIETRDDIDVWQGIPGVKQAVSRSNNSGGGTSTPPTASSGNNAAATQPSTTTTAAATGGVPSGNKIAGSKEREGERRKENNTRETGGGRDGGRPVNPNDAASCIHPGWLNRSSSRSYNNNSSRNNYSHHSHTPHYASQGNIARQQRSSSNSSRDQPGIIARGRRGSGSSAGGGGGWRKESAINTQGGGAVRKPPPADTSDTLFEADPDAFFQKQCNIMWGIPATGGNSAPASPSLVPMKSAYPTLPGGQSFSPLREFTPIRLFLRHIPDDVTAHSLLHTVSRFGRCWGAILLPATGQGQGGSHHPHRNCGFITVFGRQTVLRMLCYRYGQIFLPASPEDDNEYLQKHERSLCRERGTGNVQWARAELATPLETAATRKGSSAAVANANFTSLPFEFGIGTGVESRHTCSEWHRRWAEENPVYAAWAEHYRCYSNIELTPEFLLNEYHPLPHYLCDFEKLLPDLYKEYEALQLPVELFRDGETLAISEEKMAETILLLQKVLDALKDKTVLYIHGFSNRIAQDHLRYLFGEFGSVQRCSVLRSTQMSLVGVIQYASSWSALRGALGMHRVTRLGTTTGHGNYGGASVDPLSCSLWTDMKDKAAQPSRPPKVMERSSTADSRSSSRPERSQKRGDKPKREDRSQPPERGWRDEPRRSQPKLPQEGGSGRKVSTATSEDAKLASKKGHSKPPRTDRRDPKDGGQQRPTGKANDGGKNTAGGKKGPKTDRKTGAGASTTASSTGSAQGSLVRAEDPLPPDATPTHSLNYYEVLGDNEQPAGGKPRKNSRTSRREKKRGDKPPRPDKSADGPAKKDSESDNRKSAPSKPTKNDGESADSKPSAQKPRRERRRGKGDKPAGTDGSEAPQRPTGDKSSQPKQKDGDKPSQPKKQKDSDKPSQPKKQKDDDKPSQPKKQNGGDKSSPSQPTDTDKKNSQPPTASTDKDDKSGKRGNGNSRPRKGSRNGRMVTVDNDTPAADKRPVNDSQ